MATFIITSNFKNFALLSAFQWQKAIVPGPIPVCFQFFTSLHRSEKYATVS